jgi:uncharacterized Fe-S cluster protein YjdI
MKIQWDEKQCSHSGQCVKSLPEVFKVENGQFMIEPDKAAENEVVNVIKQCPSSALKHID